MGALGRHVLVELFGCTPGLLNDVVHIKKTMEHAARQAAATIINSTFHHFNPIGVSGVVVIQESHLAIHTWPEYGFAAVDVFTCGEGVDPWKAYRALKTGLAAQHGAAMELHRGQAELLGQPDDDVLAKLRAAKTDTYQGGQNSIWFTERHQNIAVSVRHKGDKLYQYQSPYQYVEVYDTHQFGRMLALDGVITCTEKDEYAYHEMAAHVPVCAYHGIKRVLVVGGGDGGVARELLKHQSVEEVVIVEIDRAVVEATRQYMPSLHAGLTDARVTLVFENGHEFVAQQPNTRFDLVIVDADVDAVVGHGKAVVFYEHIRRVLATEGIMVSRTGAPGYDQEQFSLAYKGLYNAFGESHVFCYLVHVSTYPMGLWSFSFCAKGNIHPVKSLFTEKAATFAKGHNLSYYNADVHQSAFALPSYIQRLLNDL